MKVLLINNCHWRRGGSETVYFGTAELLMKAGHEVVFLSLEDEKNISTGQKEYLVKRESALKNIVAYFSNKEAAKVIESVIKVEKPDIAHTHLMWGGVTASIIPVLHKYRIPVVHTVHDYRMVCPAYTLKNGNGLLCKKCQDGQYWHCLFEKCCKSSYPKSAMMATEMYFRNIIYNPPSLFNALIYVSHFGKNIQEQMDARFKDVRAYVLYNFVLGNKDIYRIEADVAYGNYYLYYGRLSYEKGVMTLIKAFEVFPNLKLVIMGNGPLKDELNKYVIQRRLNNVEFFDARTGKSLYEVVSKAKFIVAPSEWYEMMGLTVVEGYSMSVPALASDIGGLSEIVKDGETGIQFKAGDIESLKEGIKRCESLSLSDYSTYRNSAYKYGKNFSENIYLNNLLEIYNEVIGGNIRKDFLSQQ